MLLQNLYNKVIGFFRQTDIEQETESAKETACNSRSSIKICRNG